MYCLKIGLFIFMLIANLHYAYSEDNKNFWKPIDKTHDVLSKKIVSLSSSIDAYFAGKKYEDETNNSYIKTGYQVSKYGNNSINQEALFKAKVALPLLQKKLNLIVEDIRKFDQDQNTDSSSRVQTAGEVSRVQSLTAALRFEFLKESNWKIDNDAGIKVRLPLDPYYRFRVSWNKVLLQRWYAYYSQKFSWFNSSGWASFTDLYFDTPIYPSLLFRFYNSSYWSDKNSTIEWLHRWSFYKIYSTKLISEYYFALQSQTKNEVTSLLSYSVGVSFRYKIYKDWLFLNVNPSLTFSKENHFRRELGALVGIELFMGSI